jgi:hypothetical protein
MLGYELAAQGAATRHAKPSRQQIAEPSEVQVPSVQLLAGAPLADAPFWRLEQVEFLDPVPPRPREPSATRASVPWRGRPDQPPTPRPLASWRELLPRLRNAVARQSETRAVDIQGVVERLSRGEVLHRLPRKPGRHWGDSIQILLDCSPRLIPYWLDQLDVCLRLQQLFAHHAVEVVVVREGPDPWTILAPSGEEFDYRGAPPGSTVLMLGDLGCLDRRGRQLRDYWIQVGRWLCDSDDYPVALMPCPPQRWAAELQTYWRLLPWEMPAHGPGPAPAADWQARAHRLLRLLSPAIRIEPGLLRAVRLLLPAGQTDAGTEADVWQHPALSGNSWIAATLDADEANQLRDQFAREEKSLRGKVLAEIRRWRAGLAPEIWFVELLGLDRNSQDLLADERDVEDAVEFVRWLSQRVTAEDEAGEPVDCEEAFFCRVEPRLDLTRRIDERLREDWHAIWRAVHRHEPQLDAPLGYDPREASWPDHP